MVGPFDAFDLALLAVLVGTLALATVIAAILGDVGAEFTKLRRRTGVGPGVALLTGAVGVLALWLPFALGEGVRDLAGVGILVALGGLALVAVSVANADEYVRLRRAPAVDPGTASGESGTAAVGGSADARDPITAPLSGADAVCCEYRIERRVEGRYSEGWTPVAVGRETTDFALADDTGDLPVDPADADLRLSSETTVEVGPDETPPDRAAALADREGVSLDARRRFVESRLDHGAAAAALGTLGGGRLDAALLADRTLADLQARFRHVVLVRGALGLVLFAGGEAAAMAVTGAI